jgi:uncharacterized coiled-coil DUF342 family protein
MKYLLIFLLLTNCAKSITQKEIEELRKENRRMAREFVNISRTHSEFVYKYKRKLAEKDTIISYLKSRKRNANRRIQIPTDDFSY